MTRPVWRQTASIISSRDAGEFKDSDDPAITRVAMLIPFARPLIWSYHWQRPARRAWRTPAVFDTLCPPLA